MGMARPSFITLLAQARARTSVARVLRAGGWSLRRILPGVLIPGVRLFLLLVIAL